MPSPKPSVVHVIDRLETGGAEKVVVFLANLLHQNGHSVKVITTVSKGPQLRFLNPSIPFTCINRNWKWNPFHMLRLKRACRGFDVIHLHGTPTLKYAMLTKKLFVLKGKIIFHAHNSAVFLKERKWLLRLLLKETVMIATSQEVATAAKDIIKINKNRVFCFTNTIVKPQLKYPETKKSYQLVQVSNIVPHKNISFSIELMKKLSLMQCLSFHLTIIGKIYDKKYFDHLNKTVWDNGLSNCISFITGCDDVLHLLSEFTLGLHTSANETGPVSIAEYLACELPFLAYRTGEVSEIIFSELPEFFMDDFDIDSWVSRILHLEKQSKANGLTQAKMKAVYETHFSADRYYLRYNKVLQRPFP